MIINVIKGVTRTLGKSQGYLGLPIRDEKRKDVATGQATNTMTSSWEPTPAELERIKAGKPIYVSIFGTGHPPIMVYVPDEE